MPIRITRRIWPAALMCMVSCYSVYSEDKRQICPEGAAPP